MRTLALIAVLFPSTLCAQYMTASFPILSTITVTPTTTPTAKYTDVTLLDGRPECQSTILVSTLNSLFFHVGCAWENTQCCPSPTSRVNRQYFDNCPADYGYVDPDGTGTMLACCPRDFEIVRIAVGRDDLADPICASRLKQPLTLNSTAPAYYPFYSEVTADPSVVFALEFYVQTSNGNKMVIPTGPLTPPALVSMPAGTACVVVTTVISPLAASGAASGTTVAATSANATCIPPTTLAGSVVGTAAGAVVLSLALAFLILRRKRAAKQSAGGISELEGHAREMAEMADHKRVQELEGVGFEGIGEVEGDSRIMPPEMAVIEARSPGIDIRKDWAGYANYM